VWTEVAKNSVGSSFYIDLKTVRKEKEEGYINYYSLADYYKPMLGDMSAKTLVQGDCTSMRYRTHAYIYYKHNMGKGKGEIINNSSNWNDTANMKSTVPALLALKAACNEAKPASFLDKPLWFKGALGPNSEDYYLDLHSIKRKEDNYAYYSVFVDLPKPDKRGHRGWKLSVQGDCKLNSAKTLTEVHYTIPVKFLKLPYPSSGLIETDETYLGPSVTLTTDTDEWIYLNMKDTHRYILEHVCEQLNISEHFTN
jgi:hypothetical protein